VSGPRRFTPWRRAVQAAVAALYAGLPFLGLPWLSGTLAALRVGPVDLVEPAGALSAALAGRHLAPALLLGAAPVALLALGLGSVYCGWLCPFGLLSELLDRLRRPRARWPERAWEAARRPRRVALLLLVGGSALLGAPLAAVLSPPRVLTSLPLEARAAGVVPWVGLGLLGAFLLADLLLPRRLLCRALCPAGALAALLRAPATWRPRFEAARCRCPGHPPCVAACAWGLDPRAGAMGPRDGCTSCLACLDQCPTEALTVLRGAAPPGPAAPGSRPSAGSPTA
jgi:ferredoxin-type protein NapH